ncbi:hypothetical protein [Streptomyces liangshanensis]|uniref:DUF4232 domain-containing protein n=1 Tax=Streptomyces liangshanensis TaxID=2717324 RepID=A0A6G9GZA4_9ACTN|nr:hypothetical protein [Streptomyces liangshanensis]QIQ03396.1 hypothetical protein HA039_14565 [Streptomyces liangshanensis]
MGSLRNPVGPLPSTIYWRRRAVAATLTALLALLVVWVVTSGDGGGKKSDDRSDGANPATSITPGPSGSGPAISEQPGGRDESGGTGGSGGDGGTDGGAGDSGKNGDPAGSGGAGAGAGGAGTGGAGSGGAGTGGTTGAANGGTGGGGTSGGGTGTAGTGGAGSASSGRQVPANSSLPTCVRGSLILRLDVSKNAYEPGEKPAFRLIATNTSTTACKADFGPKAMVLTVTDAEDDQLWSSKDCPRTGRALFEVPAGATITRTVQWDRAKSAPKCAKAPAGAVAPGTYLVEITTTGASVQQGQKSIRLEKD